MSKNERQGVICDGCERVCSLSEASPDIVGSFDALVQAICSTQHVVFYQRGHGFWRRHHGQVLGVLFCPTTAGTCRSLGGRPRGFCSIRFSDVDHRESVSDQRVHAYPCAQQSFRHRHGTRLYRSNHDEIASYPLSWMERSACRRHCKRRPCWLARRVLQKRDGVCVYAASTNVERHDTGMHTDGQPQRRPLQRAVLSCGFPSKCVPQPCSYCRKCKCRAR